MSATHFHVCIHCGKRKKKPAKDLVSRTHYELDPFCSRVCCEAYHGTEQRSTLGMYAHEKAAAV